MQSYEAIFTVRRNVTRMSLFSFIIQLSAIKQHEQTLFSRLGLVVGEPKPNLVQLLKNTPA